MRVVMKFGGTSVGSIDAIRRVVDIIKHTAQQHQIAVVVSAMNAPDLRTTNTLINISQAAAAGNGKAAADVTLRLLDMHMQVARELATPAECQLLESELRSIFETITRLAESIAVLGELTPRALDMISGQGERCNARLIAAALRSSGMESEAVDATELITTDNQYNNASPLMDETRLRCHQRLSPLFEQGSIPVVTGFIGATRDGVLTTLGRGGSDYSCAVLGAVLDANEVWFWKEVNGVMTANPSIVPEAHTIPVLSYIEMAELSYYGANVLHPRTVYPLVQRSIPIRILNTFQPDHAGTRVTADTEATSVRAVTSIHNVSLITVGGPGMLGLTGVAARICNAVARARANILFITQASSEQNISIVVPSSEATVAVDELRRDLAHDISHHTFDAVELRQPVVIVAVVGGGMRGTPGIAGKVFGALGNHGINVVAIAQGSSEYNISLVVDDQDGNVAVRVIHNAFSLDR